MAIPLKKLNEKLAALLQTQSFTATLGTPAGDTLWATAVPNILNGNSILIMPGPASSQITLKASAIVMTVPLAGFIEIRASGDTLVNTSVFPPPGARTDGTNYFFSQFTTWNETPVLLANKFSHIYIAYDVTKPNNMAIGVVSNASISDPGSGILSNIGVTVSARQAVCYVDATGRVTILSTFPGIYGSGASVVADSVPSFIDWAGAVTAIGTNAILVKFTFPAGTGTGAVGEIAVNLGGDIVAFLPISPQLLKDSDVPLVLKWMLMIGEPGAFLP